MGRSAIDDDDDVPCALPPLLLFAVLFLVVLAVLATAVVGVGVGVLSIRGKYRGDEGIDAIIDQSFVPPRVIFEFIVVKVPVEDKRRYDMDVRKSST